MSDIPGTLSYEESERANAERKKELAETSQKLELTPGGVGRNPNPNPNPNTLT